jgi:hypothetical protein
MMGMLDLRVPVDIFAEIDALKNLYMLEALRVAKGNESRAAQLIGVSRTTFQHWRITCEARTAQIAREAVDGGVLV